jgi:amino acid adenylation domain-containing protein
MRVRDLGGEVGQESFALTSIQKSFLAESLIASNKRQNVEQVVWELDHVPNVASFRAAWQSALDAFDALRLQFELQKSSKVPRQKVRSRVEVPFRELDFWTSDRGEHRARIEQFLEKDRSVGFDLMSVPLMRVSLLILGPDRAACVWTIHHSIIDGPSCALVLQKVFQQYIGSGKATARPADMPPPFADFLRWMARHDAGPATKHFAEQLRDFDAPTPLPLLQKDPGLPAESSSARTTLRLDGGAADRLRAIARETATTPNAVVQLAWALLLSGYAGEADVVFGTTWTGRPGTVERAEEIVGPFVSTVPVRVNLLEAGTVRDALVALRCQHLGARPFLHAELSEIKASSSLARAAHLFQTLVVFDDKSVQAELEGRDERWRSHRIWLRSQTAYPLVLSARLEEGELELELELDVRLYGAEDATRLLADYVRLLAGIGDRLEDSPFAVSMLDPDVASQLSLGEAEREIISEKPIAIARILEQTRRRAGRVAIEQIDGDEITYAELERRVLRLASVLRGRGVEAGTLVGVYLPRSIDAVVAMLAVHAAGGAFVPIAPEDPKQRVEYVLRDSKAALVVVNRETRGRLPRLTAVEIDVDELGKEEGSTSAVILPDPTSLAYVIYTSGSTGEPKGVCVPQSALANHLAAILDVFALTPADRVLQFSTPTFDAALEEILPTLAAGATLVLRSDAMSGSVRGFFEGVAREQISVVDLPTAFWHQLARTEHLQWPSCLRLVVTGGENASARSHRKFREGDTGHLRWLNTYGPTEATISSTCYDDSEGDHGPDGVPIGRPLPGVSHFVLDRHMRLVPPGAVGQLYVGGAGLATGYWSRDELTAQRFVEHPWRPGARLYATGDRVRRTRAGNFVYVDRIDHQVKVRGFRVELGEIESQLLRHPSVRQAAVVARTGDGSLAAFVVADEEVSERALLDHLAAALPAHMLPARVIARASLPMTLSGKVDRRALARFDSLEPISASMVEPGSIDESDPSLGTLREIWAEVLGVRAIDSSSSFFDLGGHSLLVVRMFSEVERRFGKACNAAAFFRNPTVSHLAELLCDAPDSDRSGIVQLAKGSPRIPPLFFAPGLTGRAIDFVHLVQALSGEVPVYALQLLAFQDAERPGEKLRDAVKDIVDLMQQVQPHGPYAIAGYSAGGVFAVAMAEEVLARSESTDFVGIIDCAPPATVPMPSPFTSPRRLLRLSKTVANRVREILDRPRGLPELWTRTRAATLRSFARWNVLARKYRPTVGELFGEIPGTFSVRDVDAMQRYLDEIVDLQLGQLGLDLVLFRTPTDPPEGPYEHDLGWRRVTTGAVVVEQVGGRHGDLLTSRGCGELARHFNAHLRRREPRKISVDPKLHAGVRESESPREASTRARVVLSSS